MRVPRFQPRPVIDDDGQAIPRPLADKRDASARGCLDFVSVGQGNVRAFVKAGLPVQWIGAPPEC